MSSYEYGACSNERWDVSAVSKNGVSRRRQVPERGDKRCTRGTKPTAPGFRYASPPTPRKLPAAFCMRQVESSHTINLGACTRTRKEQMNNELRQAMEENHAVIFLNEDGKRNFFYYSFLIFNVLLGLHLVSHVGGLMEIVLGVPVGVALFCAFRLVLIVSGTLLERGELRAKPGRKRREDLRSEVSYLRGVVKAAHSRLSFEEIETVEWNLLHRAGDKLHPDAGLRERFLWKLRNRRRRLVGLALDGVWQRALPQVVEHLDGVRKNRSYLALPALVVDDVPTAWYLPYSPANPATRRLLAEYVTVDGKPAGRHAKFVPGVVFTPRWVYELVKGTSPRDAGGTTRASECVEVGNADRDAIANLYEHEGSGPMGSLVEVVEVAKRL